MHTQRPCQFGRTLAAHSSPPAVFTQGNSYFGGAVAATSAKSTVGAPTNLSLGLTLKAALASMSVPVKLVAVSNLPFVAHTALEELTPLRIEVRHD